MLGKKDKNKAKVMTNVGEKSASDCGGKCESDTSKSCTAKACSGKSMHNTKASSNRASSAKASSSQSRNMK